MDNLASLWSHHKKSLLLFFLLAASITLFFLHFSLCTAAYFGKAILFIVVGYLFDRKALFSSIALLYLLVAFFLLFFNGFGWWAYLFNLLKQWSFQ